ncbi:MAG: multi-sensor signal transduction histidine kinase [Polaromonas sp.]|nr:multi-sensor signal transduction histidine kinase [Polaromonas sp.]
MLSWLGLRSRLVLLVLLALVPVFGLFAYSAARNQEALVTLTQDSLQSEALLAASHQQLLVERAAQLLGDIASGPSVSDGHLCTQYLQSLHLQNPGYTNLGVVGLDGQLTCDAMSSSPDRYSGDQEFFRQVLAEQKFLVGGYALSRATKNPRIAFGMPVYSSAGALNGVAFGTMNINEVAQELGKSTIMEGAQLRVIDRKGIVLASHPVIDSLQGKQEQDTLVFNAVKSKKPGLTEAVDSMGILRVYAYALVGGIADQKLVVAISVPHDVITAAPRESLKMDIAALLVVTAFGMACAWAMGKRLVVNPANALLKEANEIARGNLAPRVKLERWNHDEIGRLGQAFNHMADSLQVQRNALDDALRQADSERAMLDLILNSMSEGVIAVDNEGHFLLFNATACKIFPPPEPGMLLKEWKHKSNLLNNKLFTLEATGSAMPEGPLTQILRGAAIDNCELLYAKDGAENLILRISGRPLFNPDKQQVGALMVFIDVTQPKAAERFALAQEQVLMLIAGGAPVHDSLEAVVRLIEKTAPQTLCSILLVEDGCLRYSVAPSLPPDFVQATDALMIAEGVGVCGTAAFRKETVIVEDVMQEPLLQNYHGLLEAHGMRACWSTPVMAADGELLAIFANYRKTAGGPQAGDLALIASATRLARLALERVRSEAALVSSEVRFKELADNVEDVFYSINTRTHEVLYISPSYEKVWGRSCESLYASPSSYLKAVLPADRHIMQQAIERSLLGKSTSMEYRISLPDGQVRWISGYCFPVMNAAGTLERVVGTGSNITEQKLADLELARSNRALQMLSRSSIAINRVDDELALLAEVCRVAVDVGGYRMAWVGYARDDEQKTIQPAVHAGEELNCLKSIKLCWRDDHPTGRGPAGKAIRTGQPQQTGDIRKADNEFYWIKAAVRRGYLSSLMLPLRNEQRSFGLLCLYSAEVQEFAPEEVQLLQELADNLAFGIVSLRVRLEQRRSQEAARLASARLHEQASLIDLAPDAIMVFNLDRTLRFWSKGAERLYGWTAAEVLGKTMEGAVQGDSQMPTVPFQRILAGNGDWAGELEQRTKGGAVLHVEARSSVVLDENGEINGVMGVVTNIHERRKAREEILQLNASLEERVEQRTGQLKFANQQLEAFSYSVSHDLRTPLSTVNGFSNLLEKSLTHNSAGPPLSDRNRHYLARIRAGAGQMGELIDAMLSLAQVSRSTLCWEQVDLGAQAQALLLGYQERSPDRAVQLAVQPGLTAQGDPRLLRQVLDNLLGNAWKFTAKQMCPSITVGQEQGRDGETVFFVRDNGPGFDMAYVGKLFGAFQRLHTEAEFAGTGIGLATVQRIIARHGGRVWAESCLGQGATFFFTLGRQPP